MPGRTRFAPVLIAGAGGHAKVLLDALRMAGEEIYGLCDADPVAARARFEAENIIGDDAAGLACDPAAVRIAIGVGSVRAGSKRQPLYEEFAAKGFEFATIMHPAAIVADSAEIEDGAQIMAGAIIQPDAIIGRNAVINTGACIDHDCRIGNHAFIAPGVTLSGAVTVGASSHIGAGATVIEGRRIGENATIGAGAVVTADIAAGATAIGVPARETGGA